MRVLYLLVILCDLWKGQAYSGLYTKSLSHWLDCPADQTLFYHGLCLTCLVNLSNQTQPSIRNSTNEIPHDIFFECPIEVSAFTRETLHLGATKLNGKELKIVTIQRHPFSKVIELSNSNKTYSGVVFELLHAMVIKHNFSMTIFTPPDGNWGSKRKNGTWNGMIGLIIGKEADIGAASFSVTVDRAKVIDFTVAFHQEPTAILIPAPTEGEKFTVLIRPLSKEVWLAVGLTIGIISPTFYALHVLSLSIRWEDKTRRGSFINIMSGLAMFITGSLVQESVVSPVNETSRFLIAIWWMITLIIANTYIAFLVSFLSAPKLHNLVDSLEDLIAQDDLHWTFRLGTAHYSLFKSETSAGVFKEIGDRVDDKHLVKNDYDGVAKVIGGDYAFIKEKSFLDVALGQDFDEVHKCRLTLAKEEFFTVGVGLALHKRSSYLALFDFEISNTISTGLMEKWKQLHWPNNLMCADAAKHIISTQPKTRKLGFDDFQGAYFLLCSGLVIATTGFIAEKFFNFSMSTTRKLRKKSRKKPKEIFTLTYLK